jgi:hypothetical protein
MKFLTANWHVPKFVRACTTTLSNLEQPNDYNLCLKNATNPLLTLENREKVKEHFGFKTEPAWLNQIHSNKCIPIPEEKNNEADASFTRNSQQPLVILTADCLPILISHQSKPEIAAIHAGWKGLYAGIIEQTMANLLAPPEQYTVWFGPAICEQCYPIGDEFRANFLKQYSNTEHCFNQREQWHFSLTKMSEHIFKQLGTTKIFHSNICTFENKAFYSYRRENGQTGRIASFIWMEEFQ